MYVGYSHSFGGGAGRKKNLSTQERRQRGKISGRVFEDKNGNGIWEIGEVGVPDVSVNIVGVAQQKTDGDGRFALPELRPGNYQFGVEAKTLPIEYTVLAAGEVALQVVADKTASVDIPVVRTGKIWGIVF